MDTNDSGDCDLRKACFHKCVNLVYLLSGELSVVSHKCSSFLCRLEKHEPTAVAFHANSEELHLEFEFREIFMSKSYEYAKISDYELGKVITKEFFKDIFHPEGFFPRLIWEIIKDPTGMLMDLPLEAIAKKPKGDQIGYNFTTLEGDEPFIYFKRED